LKRHLSSTATILFRVAEQERALAAAQVREDSVSAQEREQASGQVTVAAQAQAAGLDWVVASAPAWVLAQAAAAAQARVQGPALVAVQVQASVWDLVPAQELAAVPVRGSEELVPVSARAPVLDSEWALGWERARVVDLAAAVPRRFRNSHQRGVCRPRQCQHQGPYRDAARRREM
jgi:hypothetical protein